MSSKELSEWVLYEQIDPWGLNRFDMLAAMIMALIANVNRNPKRNPTPYTVETFLPDWEATPEDITPEQRKEMLMSVLGPGEKPE